MSRRKYKAEGSFAHGANNYGFKRARWRGLDKMEIQNLMIAAIQNLGKLLCYVGDNGKLNTPVKAIKAVFKVINVTISQLFGDTPHMSEY